MTSRRTFMASILACATPPGFVRAGVLMPVAPLIVAPALTGSEILRRQALFDQLIAEIREHDKLVNGAQVWPGGFIVEWNHVTRRPEARRVPFGVLYQRS